MIVPSSTSIALAVGLAAAIVPGGASASICDPETVALDTAQADGEYVLILGKAAGQTFVARDTLIRSLTVWVGNDGDTFRPMRLWITRVDSAGRPRTHDVLFQSPIVRPPPASYPEHRWIPARFLFDPPLVLPGSGRYAFFLQDPCRLSSWVAFNKFDDVYPEGQFWFTGRAGPVGCDLAFAFIYQPGSDAIFEIEFCHDATTPVRQRTWGEVKTTYR